MVGDQVVLPNSHDPVHGDVSFIDIGSASSASGIRPLELLPLLCDHWACYRVLQCRWQHSDAEVLVTALLPVREVDAPGGGDLVELPLDNGAAIKTFLPGSCSGVLV